jgi:hypothetical protein
LYSSDKESVVAISSGSDNGHDTDRDKDSDIEMKEPEELKESAEEELSKCFL